MSQHIDEFDILLEHDIDQQYQYEPGELLCGRVRVVVREPIKISAIHVQIRGESNVSWDEGDDARGDPITCAAEELYVSVTQNIIEDELEDGSMTLERGESTFSMEYKLPDNLPSSFIGKHGSITYVCKATLREDKRFGLSTRITSEPFLVLRRLDLSRLHNLLMAREETVVRRYRGFCVGGKVNCTFKVNKTGHVPGEDIFMDAEISNDSPRVVEGIEASLTMHSTFYDRRKRSRFTSQIVNKKRDEWELTKGEGRRWKQVRLTIPPYIPESNLEGCALIDIKYELVFRVDVSGKRSAEITCAIPITVGSALNESTRTQHDYSSSATMSRWRSRDDVYNDATLPIRSNNNIADYTATSNGERDVSGVGVASHDDVDAEMYSESTLNFRRPMEAGGVRENPLLALMSNGDDAPHDMAVTSHPPLTPTYDEEEERRLQQRREDAIRRERELYIEPDTTEGASDEDDGVQVIIKNRGSTGPTDFPPPPTPTALQLPQTPTDVPPSPHALPPAPPQSPPPPALRPGP